MYLLYVVTKCPRRREADPSRFFLLRVSFRIGCESGTVLSGREPDVLLDDRDEGGARSVAEPAGDIAEIGVGRGKELLRPVTAGRVQVVYELAPDLLFERSAEVAERHAVTRDEVGEREVRVLEVRLDLVCDLGKDIVGRPTLRRRPVDLLAELLEDLFHLVEIGARLETFHVDAVPVEKDLVVRDPAERTEDGVHKIVRELEHLGGEHTAPSVGVERLRADPLGLTVRPRADRHVDPFHLIGAQK